MKKKLWLIKLQVIPPSDGVIVWNDIPVNSIITESIEFFFLWPPVSGDVIYEIEFYSGTAIKIFL